jgi:hypothetical protein
MCIDSPHSAILGEAFLGEAFLSEAFLGEALRAGNGAREGKPSLRH